MPISSAGVSNYANVTSGAAIGVNGYPAGAVAGAGVTSLFTGVGNFLVLQTGDYLLQETGAYPNNGFLLEVQ
jgi:hypothetical protein